MIYQREVGELRAAGQANPRWDNVGFWFAYKAVLLEGLEGPTTLVILLAGVCLVSWVGVRMLASIAPQGARVAVRNI